MRNSLPLPEQKLTLALALAKSVTAKLEHAIDLDKQIKQIQDHIKSTYSSVSSDYRKYHLLDKRINELEMSRLTETDADKLILILEELSLLKEVPDIRNHTG
jgi:hypothetical protein